VTSVTPPESEVVANGNGDLFVRTCVAGKQVVGMSDGSSHTVSAVVAAPFAVASPWRVEFPPERGAPARIDLAELASWTTHSDPGVKYFSGTASYRTTFDLGAPPERLLLDLGDVQVMAEVVVNGKNLGVLWKPPFRVEVGDAVKQGRNDLELRITNLWPNRMIGDEEFPDDVKWMENAPYPVALPDWVTSKVPRDSPRITFSTRRTFKKGDPLLASGLLGPVRLIPQASVALQVRLTAGGGGTGEE